ncbi:MAG: hypothetical protein ACXWKH_20070 [Limisphaerales bacterium]
MRLGTGSSPERSVGNDGAAFDEVEESRCGNDSNQDVGDDLAGRFLAASDAYAGSGGGVSYWSCRWCGRWNEDGYLTAWTGDLVSAPL